MIKPFIKYFSLVSIVFLLNISQVYANQLIKEVRFSGISVKAEVAQTNTDREQGLMYRQSLKEGQGMLFIFDQESYYNFWMKNMNFPLDFIWINHDKIIVDISENVPPCKEICASIAPVRKAQYVLEVKSGFTKENHIKIGDKVSF